MADLPIEVIVILFVTAVRFTLLARMSFLLGVLAFAVVAPAPARPS